MGRVRYWATMIPSLEKISAKAVLADKAYDTNELRDWLKVCKIKVVIPLKSNQKDDIAYDFWLFLLWRREI